MVGGVRWEWPAAGFRFVGRLRVDVHGMDPLRLWAKPLVKTVGQDEVRRTCQTVIAVEIAGGVGQRGSTADAHLSDYRGR